MSEKTFVREYDLNATVYTYLATSVSMPGPLGLRIKTVGASTTVTAVSGSPFLGLAVGDELIVNRDGTFDRVFITVKASDASVTVSASVNWENGGVGYNFDVRLVRGGTAATDGWHDVRGWSGVLVKVEALLITGTGGIDYSIEGRLTGDGATVPLQLATGNIASVTFPANGTIVPVMEGVSSVRVGLKWGTANGAGPDSVSVYLSGEPSGVSR